MVGSELLGNARNRARARRRYRPRPRSLSFAVKGTLDDDEIEDDDETILTRLDDNEVEGQERGRGTGQISGKKSVF